VCWGKNDSGQIGNGKTTNAFSPVELANSANLLFTSIRAAHSHSGLIGYGAHTCAKSLTNIWYCWGQNKSGQLGTDNIDNHIRPVEVGRLDGAIDVSLGTSGGCAIFPDENVRCWGDSGVRFEREKFGAGPRAVTVENLKDVTAISVGGKGSFEGGFSCALSVSGVVSCWGHNDKGQLGVGTLQASALPVPVSLPSVTDISSGGSHSCAVSDGQVYCWGSNTNKYSIYPEFKRTMKLGSDGLDQSPTPILVNGLSKIEFVAAGSEHSCALSKSGDVYCWGDHAADFEGVSAAPKRIAQLPTRAKQISAGTFGSCALLENGEIYCWYGRAPARVSIPSDVLVLNVAVGLNQFCATAMGGAVYCWGGNDQGQLGDGSTLASNFPVKVAEISSAQSVAASGVAIFFEVFGFSCALLSRDNGSVSCWGSNEFDQLGDGSGVDQPTPVPILGLHGIKQIASGGTHSCALYHDGYVACWGGFFGGQLGQAPLTPRVVLQ
jgi:alpha-tubulin suppressor-like RCC1 family protein